jgi:hypothetical protein
MIDPLARLAISLAFAALLAAAAWHKSSQHGRFVAALDEYRLLPRSLCGPVAWMFAALEAALAVGWLTDAWVVAAGRSTATLLMAYAAAMGVNLLRGRVHIGCGCGLGGSSGREPTLSWWLVARNLVLAAIALVVTLPRTGRELVLYDRLTAGLVFMAAVVLHAAVSQLAGNASVIDSWSRPRD